MYDQSSGLIAGVLFVTLLIAIEAGYRVGRKSHSRTNDSSKAQVNAVQASLLGILALLLAFTFSLSLQRFDRRSDAVVDEANAIGTAYLRAQLLPEAIRGSAQQALRDYLDVRVLSGSIALDDPAHREPLLVEAGRIRDALWRCARLAAEADPNPVTSGLFVQAVNELIDSYGRREAALDRHVPEAVLFLLAGAFLLTGSIVGYASGVGGHRVPFATYVMVALIVILVFIIIDLDRPRRGLIRVDHTSMSDLQATMRESLGTDSP